MMIETARQTVKITDNGMNYEIDFVTYNNDPKNIANGANAIINSVEAYKLRADGSRGLRLKGANKRLCEVARKARQ